MSNIPVIILAAGKGTRLAPLTLNCPKSLLPIGSKPLLVRTIYQLKSIGFKFIHVVVGYLHQQIVETLRSFFNNDIQFIYNNEYMTDTNTGSLHLGLTKITGPSLVVEGDVILPDGALPLLLESCQSNRSIWFTNGPFQTHQQGGIIKYNDTRQIIDMRIVSKFTPDYSVYSKNLGIVYIGPGEINLYKSILAQAFEKDITNLYYMQHWISHLEKLPCQAIDLYPACSFNTLDELEYCKKLLTLN